MFWMAVVGIILCTTIWVQNVIVSLKSHPNSASLWIGINLMGETAALCTFVRQIAIFSMAADYGCVIAF